MKKKRSALFLFVFLITLFTSNMLFSSNKLADIRSWLCLYSADLPQEAPKYDLYILDSSNHPPLEPLKAMGSKVAGYISLGEVAKHNSFFEEIKAMGLLVDENKNWPGSYRVDIKNKKWHEYVIKKLIPEILKKGFDGIFIDTIDTAWYLENDKKMPDQMVGAKELLLSIRKKFPRMVMVLNGGLFLTDVVGKKIDALVVESIYTHYNFKDKRYGLAAGEWTKERAAPAKAFKKKFKKPVLVLEYLQKSDKAMIKEVVKKAESEGFIPYIAEIDLKNVFFHP